jgi:ABC-type nitrate/sulfonate/bicarbonate transport system substrate-binding protein
MRIDGRGLAAFLFVSCVTILSEAKSAEFKGTTLGMPAPSWSTRLPVAVAEEGGFFKAENIEVRAVVASGGPLMMALLLSGHAEMVMSGANAVAQAISRGAPISIVGGVRNRMDYALIGSKGFKTLKDLKGKFVGVTGVGSLGEFVTLESLRRSGLIRDRDYTVVYIEGGPATRMAALRTGRVAAVPLTPGQRVVMTEDGFPVLLEVGHVLPELPSTVLVSTKQIINANPNALVKILRALGKSMDLIRADKDKAVQMGQAYGLRGEAALERKALNFYANDFDVRLRRESIAAVLNSLKIKGSIDEYFVDTFVSRAVR